MVTAKRRNGKMDIMFKDGQRMASVLPCPQRPSQQESTRGLGFQGFPTGGGWGSMWRLPAGAVQLNLQGTHQTRTAPAPVEIISVQSGNHADRMPPLLLPGGKTTSAGAPVTDGNAVGTDRTLPVTGRDRARSVHPLATPAAGMRTPRGMPSTPASGAGAKPPARAKPGGHIRRTAWFTLEPSSRHAPSCQEPSSEASAQQHIASLM